MRITTARAIARVIAPGRALIAPAGILGPDGRLRVAGLDGMAATFQTCLRTELDQAMPIPFDALVDVLTAAPGVVTVAGMEPVAGGAFRWSRMTLTDDGTGVVRSWNLPEDRMRESHAAMLDALEWDALDAAADVVRVDGVELSRTDANWLTAAAADARNTFRLAYVMADDAGLAATDRFRLHVIRDYVGKAGRGVIPADVVDVAAAAGARFRTSAERDSGRWTVAGSGWWLSGVARDAMRVDWMRILPDYDALPVAIGADVDWTPVATVVRAAGKRTPMAATFGADGFVDVAPIGSGNVLGAAVSRIPGPATPHAMSVNARYMLDALDGWERVEFRQAAADRPLVAHNGTRTALVMPIRIPA